ncbi:MAG: sigma-70 family RNA polymerase sigma factor [Capsulimonadales bacterium]|nr:sigma-70 family RNA polymerase sigma factor [Capsulimonadales bacterium]
MPLPTPDMNGCPFDPIAERSRLTVLCHRWTGDPAMAEDLAQETILVALRRHRSGFAPREWPPFLAGIAVRLCKNHLRRTGIREAREIGPEEALRQTTERTADRPYPDPLDSLLDFERSHLLETALRHLKPEMRALLVRRYQENQPLSEIAARYGLTENAVAARLVRSRTALERVLSTALRDAANAHGLLPADAADGWRETAVYCPRCGKSRLQGRFADGTDGPVFGLRCPTCVGQLVGMTTDAAPIPRAVVLHGVSGFRAGLTRVNRWWQTYLARGLETGEAACTRCGRPTPIRRTDPTEPAGIGLVCEVCDAVTFFITPTGLLYHSDEMQAFWRRHPRLRNRPERPVTCEGRPAVLTTFSDPQGNASVQMVFDRETLRPMRCEISG